MKKIEIWEEGFACTGQSEKAKLIGVYEANDFNDAVKAHIEAHPELKVNQLYDYDGKYHSIWACRLFDNETDARKEFG